jgi:hypothetical protein
VERARHHRQGAGRRRQGRDLPDGEHRGRGAGAGLACRYPPKGTRSFGPIRSGIYGAAADTNAANDDVLVIPMIETKTALENLEAIVAVPAWTASISARPTSASRSAWSRGRTGRSRSS